jgi:transcriptional regulator with XRE-family HTH domain
MSNLKTIRTNRGLSQGKLSEISGVNTRMIQYYEQGVKDINKAQGLTLQALANALECKIEDLLETT